MGICKGGRVKLKQIEHLKYNVIVFRLLINTVNNTMKPAGS
jgi:hypothetical protein